MTPSTTGANYRTSFQHLQADRGKCTATVTRAWRLGDRPGPVWDGPQAGRKDVPSGTAGARAACEQVRGEGAGSDAGRSAQARTTPGRSRPACERDSIRTTSVGDDAAVLHWLGFALRLHLGHHGIQFGDIHGDAHQAIGPARLNLCANRQRAEGGRGRPRRVVRCDARWMSGYISSCMAANM